LKSKMLILVVVRTQDKVVSARRLDRQIGIDREKKDFVRPLNVLRLKLAASYLHEAARRSHIYSKEVALASVIRTNSKPYC